MCRRATILGNCIHHLQAMRRPIKHNLRKQCISISTTPLSFLHHPLIEIEKLTFPRPLEEEPHDEYLQASHTDHQPTLHHAKIKYPRLGALDRAEVSIFACTEVLLVAIDGR